MIGLDTNILVRYLTQGDPIQSPMAREIIERRLTEENPGFVSIVAMVEPCGSSTAPTSKQPMKSPQLSNASFRPMCSLWKTSKSFSPP
jgi:predicted nucleic acid-binding protein